MTRKPAQPDPLPEAVANHPLPAGGGCYIVEAGALVKTTPEAAAVEPPLNAAETEA